MAYEVRDPTIDLHHRPGGLRMTEHELHALRADYPTTRRSVASLLGLIVAAVIVIALVAMVLLSPVDETPPASTMAPGVAGPEVVVPQDRTSGADGTAAPAVPAR